MGRNRVKANYDTKVSLPLSLTPLLSWASCCSRCAFSSCNGPNGSRPGGPTTHTIDCWSGTSLMLHRTQLWTPTASSPAESSQPHLSQDWLKGNGTLQTEGCNSMQKKLFRTSHPLAGASSSTPRTLLSLAMEKGHPHTSLITLG